MAGSAGDEQRVRLWREAERVPPAELVGKHIDVDDLGSGFVLAPFKKGTFFGLGPSKHKVCFEADGRTSKLKPRRHSNGGHRFILLGDDETQHASAHSPSGT